MPRYSIVTVCLNDKEGLQRTLSSIEEQIFKNFEWIVIDGQSIDGTAEIVSCHPLVDKFLIEPDNGIYDAMNKGIKLSCGDYLLFLNAGDQLHDNKTLLETEKYLNSDIVIGKQIVVRYNNECMEEKVFKDYSRYIIGKRYIYNQTLPHQATLFKRYIFFKYGLYNSEFAIKGDHDFFARLISNNISFSFSPIFISIYHLNGLSHMMKKNPIFKKELDLVRKNNFSFCFRTKMRVLEILK